VFRIELERDSDWACVRPRGALDMATVGELRARMDELWRAGYESIVLDLRRLDFMDSTGAHLAIQQHRQAALAGRSFSLVPGPRAVQRVFELLGLTEVLSFRDGEVT
jgi:stage II sporulation protein AA (anti-sigma F factor antagonist)